MYSNIILTTQTLLNEVEAIFFNQHFDVYKTQPRWKRRSLEMSKLINDFQLTISRASLSTGTERGGTTNCVLWCSISGCLGCSLLRYIGTNS